MISTFQDFARVFGILALQLRLPDGADPVLMAAYHEALSDQPLETIHDAAKFFAREAGRKYFPTSAEWLTQCRKQFKTELRKVLADPNARTWQHDCTNCEDTGWEILPECPGDSTCGRTKPHAPHSYARMCFCRPTNPTYQRHHQRAEA